MVLNSGQKENLYRLVDTSREQNSLLDKLSAVMFGNGTLNNANTKINEIMRTGNNQAKSQINAGENNQALAIDASITIHGDVDKDMWSKVYSTLKKHQEQVAEIVNKQTAATFNRRGVVV